MIPINCWPSSYAGHFLHQSLTRSLHGYAGAVTGLVPSGPSIAENCIRTAELDPQRDITTSPLDSRERADLLRGIRLMDKWFEDCDTAAPPGFIFYKLRGVAQRRQSAYTKVSSVQLIGCGRGLSWGRSWAGKRL